MTSEDFRRVLVDSASGGRERVATISGGEWRRKRKRKWGYASEVEAAEVEHQRQRWRRQRQSEAKAVEVKAVDAEAAEVAEAEGCIGGGSMHWKHRNASEEHGGGRS
jgi:hypothetical protein